MSPLACVPPWVVPGHGHGYVVSSRRPQNLRGSAHLPQGAVSPPQVVSLSGGGTVCKESCLEQVDSGRCQNESD